MLISARRLEQVFNEMMLEDPRGLEYLPHRHEDCGDWIMDIFTSCFSKLTSSGFEFFRRSEFIREQLPTIKKSFIWKGNVHKGSILYFDRYNDRNSLVLTNPDIFPQEDLDVLLESRALVVSRILGDFVRVRDIDSAKGKRLRTDPKTGRIEKDEEYREKNLSQKYYHLSRFKKYPMLIATPHKFKRAIVDLPDWSGGEVATHAPSLKQYKVVFVDNEEGYLSVCDLKDGDDQLIITKPIDEFRRGLDNIAGLGSPDSGLIPLQSYVQIDPDHIDGALVDMGWTLVDNVSQFKFWRNALKYWIAKVINFEERGSMAIIEFDSRNPLVGINKIDGFYLKIDTRRLLKIQNITADHILKGQAKRKGEDLADTMQSFVDNMGKGKNKAVKRANAARKKEEEEEKAEAQIKQEEQFDRENGPYNLDYLSDKLVTLKNFQDFDGEYGQVSKVNNELGRVHVKFYRGRSVAPFYFRASLGHVDHFKIISDIVVSDEGEKA